MPRQHKFHTEASRIPNNAVPNFFAHGISIAAGPGMPLELATITREMMTELRRTYRDGLPTEDLERSVRRYVKYWQDRSLAERSIVEMLEQLLVQARHEQLRLERRDLTSMDAVIDVVISRCLVTTGLE
jgi:hypothetical protein